MDRLGDNETTQTIEKKLKKGDNILEGRGTEVKRKYGYLRMLLPRRTRGGGETDVG